MRTNCGLGSPKNDLINRFEMAPAASIAAPVRPRSSSKAGRTGSKMPVQVPWSLTACESAWMRESGRGLYRGTGADRMCNLYGVIAADDEIGYYYKAQADCRNTLRVEKDYVAPGKAGYVVRLEEGQRVLSTMLWGYPTRKPRKAVPKAGQTPHVTEWWTNARNLESNMWRYSCATAAHRCLAVFTDFTEPKVAADRAEPRDLYWRFKVVDRPLAAFAGIWKNDEVEGRVFSFLTTEPNTLVGRVHPKAMPVILDETDFDRWLTAEWDEAKGLVTAYPSQLMAMS